MELRVFAERVLRGRALEDKLVPLEDPTDHAPGDPIAVPDAPGRPDHLPLGEPRTRAATPQHHGSAGAGVLRDERDRARVLHAFANHELLALELFAAALLRFPDADPRVRRGWAAAASDEQAHLRLYLDRLQVCGGTFGDEPLSRFFWSALADTPDADTFTVGMGLVLEQANLDFMRWWRRAFLAAGDPDTAAVLDRVYEDEVRHVRLAANRLRAIRAPAESEFQAFTRHLRFPLTAARARGPEPDREGRRRAGLTEAFIDQVLVSGESKGRDPRLFTFDPHAEDELAGREVRRSAAADDLATIPILLATADDVVVAPAPRLVFLRTLAEAGFPIPQVVPRADPALLPNRRARELRPWAWTPRAAAELAPLLEAAAQVGSPRDADPAGRRPRSDRDPAGPRPSTDRDPAGRRPKTDRDPQPGRTRSDRDRPDGKPRTDQDPQAGRPSTDPDPQAGSPRTDPDPTLGSGWDPRAAALFDKTWAAERAREWIGRCPVPADPADIGVVCRTEAEVEACGVGDRWIKAGLSAAGTHRIRVSGVLEERGRKWLSRALAEGPVLVEPHLDIVAELSVQGEVDRGVRILGTTRFGAVHGIYRGSIVGPADAGLSPEVRRFLNQPRAGAGFDALADAARYVGEAAAERGLRGPFGVDARVVRGPGGLRLVPIGELNPRTTMGRVALALRRRVHPSAVGAWLFLPVRALRESGLDPQSLATPVEREGERIVAGVVATTDPQRARVVGTWLVVDRSLGALAERCERIAQRASDPERVRALVRWVAG